MSLEELHAGPRLGRQLELSPSERILRLVQLGLADVAPMAIETLNLPLDVIGPLEPGDLVDASFSDLLARKGVVIDHGVQSIEPTVTDERESGTLDVPLHSPAFLFERATWDANGRAVEFVRSVYRGDRYRLTADLSWSDRGSERDGDLA